MLDSERSVSENSASDDTYSRKRETKRVLSGLVAVFGGRQGCAPCATAQWAQTSSNGESRNRTSKRANSSAKCGARGKRLCDEARRGCSPSQVQSLVRGTNHAAFVTICTLPRFPAPYRHLSMTMTWTPGVRTICWKSASAMISEGKDMRIEKLSPTACVASHKRAKRVMAKGSMPPWAEAHRS